MVAGAKARPVPTTGRGVCGAAMAAQQGALFIGVSSLCQQLDSELVRLVTCAVVTRSGRLTHCCVRVGPRAEKVLVILRDGRHLVGMLRTYDQFST